MTQDTAQEHLYLLTPEDKTAQVMAYTTTKLFWGEVVAKKDIRVSTWLRTTAAPEILTLYRGKVLVTTTPSNPPKPYAFSEIHLPAETILAFHLLPPAHDPPDYDPTEPNRYMNPTTVLIGTFQFDGHTRLSSVTNLGKYLEVTRETFTSLYDVEIRSSVMPALGVMKIPFVLVRQMASAFCLRS